MAVKIKGAPAGIKALLSGGGGSGAQVNGGSAPSPESRKKVLVDQGRAPRRTSPGAATVKRAAGAKAAQPQTFGQPYNM